jgi:hypothetical protein
MPVNNDALADLLATTLKDLPKGQFEIMWDSQNYEFCRIYQESRRQIDGGTSIQRNAILDRHGRARYRRLYDTDQPTVDQNQVVINVPWTQIGTDYSWDVLEIMRNKSSTKGFINLLESRRAERMWDLAELIETRGWLTPTSSTDTLYPYGIPYYVNFTDDGATVGGFVGKTVRYQNGTTGTVVAGIDASTFPKWRNYADIYVKVDNSLLRRLRSAVRRTRFRPAPFAITPGDDKVGTPIKLYANDDTVTELEDLSDKRDDHTQPDFNSASKNDLAGKMLHSFDGVAYFNRMPVQYVPQLDGLTVTGGSATVNTPDPIYCIDWTKLQPIVQDGYWMEESKPMVDRGQHTTFTVFLDGSHQNLCINRRTVGFVLHKALVA